MLCFSLVLMTSFLLIWTELISMSTSFFMWSHKFLSDNPIPPFVNKPLDGNDGVLTVPVNSIGSNSLL